VLISLVSWNNFLKCFNPAEEPFDGTALLVEFRIETDRSPAFRIFLGSSVDRDITFDSSFPIVLANFSGIIGCICGDDCRANLHLGNLKCFESWLVEPGVIDICWGNCAGEQEPAPIDQSTQLIPVHLFIAS